jgi:thiosulfate reductase cytochrome b subunit
MPASIVRRHSALVRLTHWINVLCLTVLLMSGLQIFNAHPALYWGRQSDFAHPWLAIRHGFPHWITIPHYQDLATGRRWHFFFAWIFVLNGFVYLTASLAGRHVWRDLLPSGSQLGGIGRSIADHLRLRLHTEPGYNVLQKLSYLLVIFGLMPLMLLTGLTMSPAIDTAFPFLLNVFSGRQSARTLHFLTAWSLLLFTLVHVVMVLLSGVLNNMRSMITGRYVPPARAEEDPL